MRKLITFLPVIAMTIAIGALAILPVSKNADAAPSKLSILQDEGKVKEKAKERLQGMYKKLEMNRDQYDEAWNVVYDYVGDFMDLKEDAPEIGNEEEVFAEWKSIKENYKEKMKSVLDDEQYKKFAEGKWGTKDRDALEAALE